MGVRTVADDKKTEQLTIRLPRWTYEALVFIAQAEKSSLNRQIKEFWQSNFGLSMFC